MGEHRDQRPRGLTPDTLDHGDLADRTAAGRPSKPTRWSPTGQTCCLASSPPTARRCCSPTLRPESSQARMRAGKARSAESSDAPSMRWWRWAPSPRTFAQQSARRFRERTTRSGRSSAAQIAASEPQSRGARGHSRRKDREHFDIPGLLQEQLFEAGVGTCRDLNLCTYALPERLFLASLRDAPRHQHRPADRHHRHALIVHTTVIWRIAPCAPAL